jgi:hypothetical protein
MNHFSRKAIFFGFLLFLLPAVEANAGGNSRITGMIKNVSGSPLCDVVIRIVRDVNQGKALAIARTDSRGFFKALNLSPGTYYLQISHQGYQPVKTTTFVLDSGRTASLNVVLQDIIGLISNNDDPRNWDLKTVMRSTSDRRLIFRNVPGGHITDIEAGQASFYRSGAMKIESGSVLDSANYLAHPQASQTGVSSNFAITEPLSQHSRMILSGQVDFGGGAFWRLRNTYNYRPTEDHDYRISAGYGQMNVNYPGYASISSQILSQETGVRDSGVRTIAVGLEGNTNFLDFLSVQYGIDYSRLYYRGSKGLFYPSVQIVVHPAEGWSVQTSFTSRRVSDTNSVALPDGEILNLAEPAMITMVDGRVSMSQIRHSEVAAKRELSEDTAVEFAVYQDRILGPGLPVMITTVTPSARHSQIVEMNDEFSAQRGARVTLKQRITDTLRASVDYVYGDALSISGIDSPVSSESMEARLGSYLQQRNLHSITGCIDTMIPYTKTNILATARWYPGNPVTPVDWFSDRMDIGTKSTNFEVRQLIPVPDFLSTTGRWEVMVNLRNVLNQGKEVLATNDGEIIVNRNPRSLRFGLSLSFR